MYHSPITNGDAGIWRSFDTARVNELINHPTIKPGLALGMGELDATGIVANKRNVILLAEHGGAMFVWTAPDVYEAHDFFLPEGRGAWARDTSKAMLSMMFDGYGADAIWAQTPVEHRACRFFNRSLGFRSRGVESAVLVPGQTAKQVEIFVLKGGDLCP